MRKAFGILGAVALSAVVWACSDRSEPSSPIEVEPNFTGTPSCVPSAVRTAAQNYLSGSNESQVLSKLDEIKQKNCTGLTAEKRAWEILKIVENAFYAGSGGTAANGAALVNGVFNFIPQGNGFTIDPKVLGIGGAFGVRGVLASSSPTIDNTAPVLTKGSVPILFGSEDGLQVIRPAILGVRPRALPADWQNVAFGSGNATKYTDDVILITAFPFGASPHGHFELNEGPNLGFQPNTQVDVVNCFTDGVNAPPDPHGPGGEGAFLPFVKRNGIVLEPVTDFQSFCQGNAPAALALNGPSAWYSLMRAAGGVLMPERLGAMMYFTDRTSIGFGGGASFFSNFSMANVSLNGTLTFTELPPAVVPLATSQLLVKVKAASGGSAAVEKVDVTLSIKNDAGVPAQIVGSFTTCAGGATSSPVGCTKELDGVADFQFTITQSGAYTICANATGGGFNFGQVCGPRFLVGPNVAPVVTSITLPGAPVAVNNTAGITASFTDGNPGDGHTATVSWGDGTSSPGVVSESNGAGSLTASHQYAVAGAYTVQVTVSDGLLSGARSSSLDLPSQIVVFHPNVAPVVTSIVLPGPVVVNQTASITSTFTDGNAGDSHTATVSWGDGTSSPGVVSESNGAGSVTANHQYAAPGSYTVGVTVSDGIASGTRSSSIDLPAQIVVSQPSASSGVWIGLRNSDDVGTMFDLKVEVLRNQSVIGVGQLNGVAGGSSGFNNAVLRTVEAVMSGAPSFAAGDVLGIRLSVRIAEGVAGHRSGTARLWYNDASANSGVALTVNGTLQTYYLRTGLGLSATPGTGPRSTVDVTVDRLENGNAFKPFGTWAKQF